MFFTRNRARDTQYLFTRNCGPFENDAVGILFPGYKLDINSF